MWELYEVEGTKRAYREALIGLPKGNGKTELAAAVGMYELLGAGITSPVVAVAAASYEQADLVFGTMRIMARESPKLGALLDAQQSQILVRNGPGRAYRVAAIAGTNDGARNSCLIADEVHEWTGNKERVHYVLANNTAKRADGLVLNITTAGYDLETLAGRLYLRGQRKQTGEADDPEFYFRWYEAAETDDPADPETWRKVNPAIGAGWWPEDNLARRFASLPLFEFKRYHLNQWTRSDECWLPPGAWENSEAKDLQLDPNKPVWVGVDVALKHDSTAVVIAQLDDDENVLVTARIWLPNEDGSLDIASIDNHLREVHKTYDVQAIGYDPAFFERSAQALLDEGLPMLEFPQSHARMVPACGQTYEVITAGRLRHNGDATFTDQVLSAEQKQTDTGWRLSKGRSRRKIDASIALVIAVDLATRTQPKLPRLAIY